MATISAEVLVDRLIDFSDLVIPKGGFKERMNKLCENVTQSLSCDRSSILLWTGSRYIGAYNFGLAAELSEHFVSEELSDLLVGLLADVEDFTVLSPAVQPQITAKVVEIAGVTAAVLCPISDSNGKPMAILTAGFTDGLGEFGDTRVQLVLGIARLVRVALMAESARESDARAVTSRLTLQLEVDQSEYERRDKIRNQIHGASMKNLLDLQHGIASLAGRVAESDIKDGLNALVAESDAAVASLERMFATNASDQPGTGVVDALAITLRSFSVGTGWHTKLTNELQTEPSDHVRGELVQIARQAVVNAELHANATMVAISIGTIRCGTQFTISDNGDGFDPELVPRNRFGLLSMRERAEGAGGSFSIDTEPGTGTTIDVWIPNGS